MKVVFSKNQTRNNNINKAPAFKAKVEFTSAARKFIIKEVNEALDEFSESSYKDIREVAELFPNSKSVIEIFKTLFEKVTEQIPGTVRYHLGELTDYRGRRLIMSYQDSVGKAFFNPKNLAPAPIPDFMRDKGKPMSWAVEWVVDEVSNVIKAVEGSESSNPFFILQDGLKAERYSGGNKNSTYFG